ncbi:gamma-glutamyltransferase [Thiohalorhabdus methylotrophus]|uniref:Glutathione hydrolase proenzyme n=1 Tax=Thiohalorhabdus methylotrophus TaxID=3242694 RepID=A0ABV4TXW6_9GAMM
MRRRAPSSRRFSVWLLILLFLPAPVWAEGPSHPAAVASAHPLATRAGREILAAGGNAFDAAVAVSAALAVVEPYSSGLGGGGFWLLRTADGREVMVDGREEAPAAASADMYQNDRGEVIEGASINGPKAAGVPGEPAALVHIAKKYGALPLERSLAPAIRYAREGFEVTERYRLLAEFRQEVLRRYPRAAELFLVDGKVPELGTVIRQPGLAKTLARIAEEGRAGFYAGPVARELAEVNQAAGGLITREDLAAYEVVERAPIAFEVAGHRVVSASPPSSGGVAIAQILRMLAAKEYAERDEVTRMHLLIEAMRRAYRDRAVHLGDTDFVDVPIGRLISRPYNAGLAATIHPEKALPSEYLPGPPAARAARHTTHFSILDSSGNRVAATLSINYPFGSGFVAGDTGVVLNDEMDDFVAKPGSPNVYGLVGGAANAIAPGKRPLSSMSPTFVEGPERTLIVGTPGGSRIITMVARAVLGSIYDEGGAEALEHWVTRRRFHHQYLPDAVQHEPDTFSAREREALEGMGHSFESVGRTFGNMQAILWDRKNGEVEAAADPRGEGKGMVLSPAKP